MGCDACSAALSRARLAALSFAICAFCSGVNSGCLTGGDGKNSSISSGLLSSASRASSSSSTSSSSWLDILFARSSDISCDAISACMCQKSGGMCYGPLGRLLPPRCRLAASPRSLCHPSPCESPSAPQYPAAVHTGHPSAPARTQHRWSRSPVVPVASLSSIAVIPGTSCAAALVLPYRSAP
jgi:hypothetical protein